MKFIYHNICIVFLSFLFIAPNIGQTTFGNEWIKPNQIYYKMKVAKDGIYRVTFEDLKAKGFPTDAVNGGDLKLINYGKEQSIYVSDAQFGEGDYVEFYGEKNTIGLDSLLYSDWKTDLFNPYYSLVSDTNAYFLTLSPQTNNLRFTLVNPNYSNNTLSPLTYYMHTEKVVYSTYFFKNVDGDVRYSNFESSEGFGSEPTQNSTTTFNINNIYANGPSSILKFRTGHNSQLNNIEISFNDNLLGSKVIQPKKTIQHSYTIGNNDLKSTNTLKLKNIASANDRHRLAYASITYPRSFSFNNESSFFFDLPAQTEKRYIEINNFNYTVGSVYVYDIDKKIRYATNNNSGSVQVLLNGSSTESRYLISNSASGVLQVNNIDVFEAKTYPNEGQEFIFVTNKVLHSPGPDYVAEYAAYRNSQAGGNYKTSIIDIQDIYNHFGYGIDRHFVSVKNFSAFMKANWLSAKHVMVLGKAVEYPYMRKENDVVNNTHKTFFVPTFGYNGSDNMLFSQGSFPDPNFSVGRLAAQNADDIKNYLDKVKLYEQADFSPQTIADKYWKKRVLHLGGGKTEYEQAAITNGLENIANILRDSVYGKEVISFYKQTGAAVQFTVNEEINALLNAGVSLVNFFGHSSAGSWDFSIQNPRDFDNYGRYPFMCSFGCYSGNLHGTSSGISESFVLEKDKGAIGFFASTGTAFISALSNYGYRFYKDGSDNLKHKGVGEIIKYIASQNRTAQFGDLALYQQLTYHGDPAISLYIDDAPDYVFDYSTLKTTPTSVQTSDKEYQVLVDIINLGANQNDSITIDFYHQLPSGINIDTVKIKTKIDGARKSITVTLKNYGTKSAGKNTLFAKIDPSNSIVELPTPEAENNNELTDGIKNGFEYYISDDIATPVYPPDFAMINTQTHFILKASTSSVPVDQGNYIFQIDTTAYFNSPLLEIGKVASVGGLIEYSPKLSLVPDRVYYWRVSPDSLSDQGYKWSSASLAFLPNEEEGWNQSHFFQFTQNEFSDLDISEDTGRKFEFGKEYNNIRLRNKLWETNDQPGYYYNNVRTFSMNSWDWFDEGISVIINNPIDLWHLLNPIGGGEGSFNPTGRSIRVYSYKTDTPENRKKAIDFLEKEMKPGYFLTFYTVQKTSNSKLYESEWASDSLLYGKSLFTVLEKLGAKKIRNLEKLGAVPYILQLVNKDNGILNEQIANNIFESLDNTSAYSNAKQKGLTTSSDISGVKSWGKLKFEYNENQGIKERSWLNIIGANLENKMVKIDSNLTMAVDYSLLAPGFKSIQLQSVQYDSLNRTSPQLKYWRTSYDPLPDAAISFVKSEPNSSNNSINQGEKVKIFYDITNVNFTPMDSILVRYTITGSDNQSTITFKRLKPLGVGEKISDVAEFLVSAGSLSEIRIIIEINPNQDQPELFAFNNVLSKQFDVAKDKTNPLLDIYFDGIKIMDGDIVSPTPEIRINLQDDNALLPITDPTLFEIAIDTGRNQLMTIPSNSPQIKFTPASSSNTEATIQYYPTLKEGEYKIIVQGKDMTGNKSGINPRSINFKVIESQSVSNVLNYPNPFSNSTQFVFTLTGDQIPDIMSISIMTLTGKVVKEITKEELGPLHIGTNKTDYKWDGTDEYGSKLANGVYLYKVNIRKSGGEKYSSFQNTKIDGFFTEGFGKMVILR